MIEICGRRHLQTRLYFMKHQDKRNTKVDVCSPGSSGPSAAGPQLLSESFQSSEFGEPAFRELAFGEVLESLLSEKFWRAFRKKTFLTFSSSSLLWVFIGERRVMWGNTILGVM